MFGTPKPAFGQATSAFGFSTPSATTSPFGASSAFGKPAAAPGQTGFGAANAFGAGNAGAAGGGGLFGAAPNVSGASGGLFGAAAPATQTGFGGFGQPSTSGLFGTNTGSSLFGQPSANTSAFGAKPAGFGGFGNPAAGTGGGLFGSAQPTTGLFGQPGVQQNTGSLFGGATGFGAAQQQSGTVIKYNPVPGTDIMLKNGQSQNINIKHHCITCMKEYEGKSLEELRLEDYVAGRRGPQNQGAFGAAAFGSPGTSTGFGGENKPVTGLFGQPTGFGQPSTSTTGGLFGKPAVSGFGGNTSAFSFGSPTAVAGATPSLFGSPAKPFGVTAAPGAPTTGLFGTQQTQPAPPFGAQAAPGAFNFGAASSQPQNTGLFGAKPATSGFDMPQTSTTGAFGGFGTSALGQQQAGGLFGAKPAATPFGTGTLGGFGTTGTNAFGAPASTPSLFGGGNAFGAKPVTSSTGFTGFGTQQTGTTGLGAGLTGLGSNTGGLFGTKPGFGGTGQTGPTLGATNFSLGSNTGLGNTGTGLTGLGGLGTGTLGQNNPSLFGSSFGGFGSNTGLGMSAGNNLGMSGANNTSFGMNNTNSGMNIHEHILSLVAKPFGDSPLLKDLVPTLAPTANDLKPTNPAAQMALLDTTPYRVSSGGTGVTGIRALPAPRSLTNSIAKKSLFDGLEEHDATLEEKLTLRHNPKRLILKPAHVGTATIDRNESLNNTTNRDVESRRQSDSGQQPNADDQNSVSDTFNGRHSPSAGNLQKRTSFSSPGTALRGINMDGGTRRASWLTTKPLNARGALSPLESAGSFEDTIAELCVPREGQSREINSSGGLYPSLAQFNSSGLLDIEDKENIDSASVAEGSLHAEPTYEPHPTGIKLTRPGYYTDPSLDDLIGYIRSDGSCVVPHFTIGRRGYGHVLFNCEMDVAGLDLDEIVHFLNKEVVIYPDDSKRPPVGFGLNRKAQITLDRVWPRDKTARHHITDPERLATMDYEGKLRNVCDKHNTKFIEYRPQTGSWVFKVDHFSKYGLSDSDEEDDMPAARPALRLGQQPIGLQGPPELRHLPTKHTVGLQGLGGLLEDQEMAMDGIPQSRMLATNGNYKALAMDTSEENSNESTTLYPDANIRPSLPGFSRKGTQLMSPTSELARFDRRSSHSVQLMKASLYNRAPSEVDASSVIDENVYSATGLDDQLVPQPASPHLPQSTVRAKLQMLLSPSPSPTPTPILIDEPERIIPIDSLSISAPFIKPKVVVLRRHRGVVPYSRSIAACLNGSCPSELPLSQGRRFRVGLGAAGKLVVPTTAHTAASLSKESNLSVLASLAEGRDVNDETSSVLLRLRLGGGSEDSDQAFKETIDSHLEACLRYSHRVSAETTNDTTLSLPSLSKHALRCPQFGVSGLSQDAASLLKEHNRIAKIKAGRERHLVTDQNCLTAQYCREVWSLCEALWGLHLEPTEEGQENPTLEAHNRYDALSKWLAETVGPTVDKELERGGLKIDDDPEEMHCASILTLLTGRRLLEACRLAGKHSDHILALILSMIGGDAIFRSLISRQLQSWCECAASDLVGRARGAILLLASGALHWPQFQPRYAHLLDWLRTFALHFWYVCPTLCSAAEAVVAYEKSLLSDVNGNTESGEGNDAANITMIMQDDYDGINVDVSKEHYAFPAPPYGENIHVEIRRNGEQRRSRVLDLRYVLLQLASGRITGTIGDATLPTSHTMDPLDYRLSWLVQHFLWSAGVSRDGPPPRVTIDFATQLETRGLWHWAVFILLFVSEDDMRTRLVREMLYRNAGSGDADDTGRSKVAFVRDELGIPEAWLRIAQAQRAKYERKHVLEAEHLVAAGEWNSAHRLIVEKIIPDAVLTDNLTALQPLLEQLSSAADRNEVFGWELGGKALYNYIKLYNEINDAISGTDVCTDEMRVMLRNASALAAVLPVHSSAGINAVVARCELSSRLATLAYTVLSLGSYDAPLSRDTMASTLEDIPLSAASAQTLVHLIAKLDLPTDYTHNILAKCVEALGDDTSESTAVALAME